jgi:hypothetical protein
MEHMTMPRAKLTLILCLVNATVILGAGVIVWRATHHAPPSTPKTTTFRAGQIPSSGKKLIHLDGGSTGAQTELFTAPTKWDVYWDFLCDEAVSPGYLTVTVLNADGTPNAELKPIQPTGISGFGDQPYTMPASSAVKLKVESNCSWHLTAHSPA